MPIDYVEAFVFAWKALVVVTTLRWSGVAAFAAVTLALSGCSGGEAKKPDVSDGPSSSVSPSEVANTHDGAIPIAVVNGWVRAVRSGNGQVACSFEAPDFRESERVRARDAGLVDGDASCERVVEAVSGTDLAPKRVTSFGVEVATDERTVLVLVRDGVEPETMNLVDDGAGWHIVSVEAGAPGPSESES